MVDRLLAEQVLLWRRDPSQSLGVLFVDLRDGLVALLAPCRRRSIKASISPRIRDNFRLASAVFQSHTLAYQYRADR